MALGQNFVLEGGNLTFQAHDWLQPIRKEYHPLEAEYLGLEPAKKPLNKAKTEDLASVRARWRGIVDDVRTRIREFEADIYILDLRSRALSTIVHPNMALTITQHEQKWQE